MDYNLRRKTILLTILAGITVILVVVFTNTGKLQKDKNMTTVSDSKEETVVLVDGNNEDLRFTRIGDDSSRWKKDETFFDNDKDTLAQRLMEEMSTLSIKAVSVERDIRVRVFDYTGSLKNGEKFEVIARNIDTDTQTGASDLDKDGVIYFADLAPGNYVVYLRPHEGYIVPDEGERIAVKAIVDYSMIEDIALKMFGEDESIVEKEDKMGLAVTADADKKLKTTIGNDSTIRYGVDVSSRNGEIDWKSVYSSGVRFAMIRAGYRGSKSGELIIDSKFKDNAKNAVYAGLDVGAYYFSQATSTVEAVEEASALLMLASEYSITYPLTIRFDIVEDGGRADELSGEERTEIAKAFCDTIAAAGKQACIYINRNWIGINLDYNSLSKNMLWLAEFHEPPEYDGYYDIWQYSDKGKVKGIDGEVCLNISYINK